jgi:hypothetical protein
LGWDTAPLARLDVYANEGVVFPVTVMVVVKNYGMENMIVVIISMSAIYDYNLFRSRSCVIAGSASKKDCS